MYQFTDDCLIGVEEIDNEHRELFRMTNEIMALLHNHILTDKYDLIMDMMKRLDQYAENHFRHEEAYMESIRHPELELQKFQHIQFRDKINSISGSFHSDEEQEAVLEDLLCYLIKWLYRHIIGSDLMIGRLKPAKERALPVFTEEYATGIPLIDKEHKELFRIIGEVYRVMTDAFIPDKYDEIIRLLMDLREYTIFHFKDEEQYMESIRYKGIEAQKMAHDAFMTRLIEMDLEHIDNNQQQTLEDMMEFLTEWLINHILNSDKKIGAGK